MPTSAASFVDSLSLPLPASLDRSGALRVVARIACVSAAVALIVLGDAVGMDLLGPWSTAYAATLSLAVASAVVFACWRLDPQAIVARRLVAKAIARRNAFEAALTERRDAQFDATVLAEKHEQARLALEMQRTNVREALERELSALASGERKVKETVAARRKLWQKASRSFANNWTVSSREVDSRYIEMVAQHEQNVQNRVAGRLAELQAASLERSLCERKITAAALPGLGAKLIERLAAAGVCSAHDVDPERLASIEGCGQKKAEMLMMWRDQCETEARARLPLFLRPDELAELRGSMAAEMQPIEAAYQRLRTALDARRVKFTAERKAAFERLNSLEWSAGEASDREANALRESHAARFRETAREATDLAARLRNAFLSARERASTARVAVAETRRAYDESSRRASNRPESAFFGWMIKTFGWRHASVVTAQRTLRSA